ncbi:MAG: type VII toxin-antitoxin system HepT family RNase toxin [Salinivenus sp.]
MDQFVGYLERAQAYSFEEFQDDIEVYSAVERNLQLAIEALSDMAGHVVTDNDLGSFERARDLPVLFEEHGLIKESEQQIWKDMISFRNVLVHEYAEINRRRVYDILQNQLEDIRRLSHVFDRFL